MKKLLKIHGNCQMYKFNQSEPELMGCCMDEDWFQLPLHPLAPGCDEYKEIKKMIPEEITNDLKEGLSLEETLIKQGTNLKNYYIPDSKKYCNHGDPKYYYFDKRNNVFKIMKNHEYYGTYKTKKATLLAIQLFEKYGWNKEDNWRVKAEVKKILGEGY